MFAYCSLLILAIKFLKISAYESVDEQNLGVYISNFTLEFLKIATAIDQENILFSPIGIGLLLSLIQQAAKGKSESELTSLLGLNPADSRKQYGSLVQSIQKSIKNEVINLGSRVFIFPECEINPKYEEIIETDYNTSLYKIDFTDKNSTEIINNWVREATGQHINSIIETGFISSATVMLLVSVIYFNDTWKNKFNQMDTEESVFHIDKENQTRVPFMVQRNLETLTGEDSELGAKWVELAYEKSPTSMLLILPTNSFQLNDVMDRITSTHLMQMMNNENRSTATVLIPKFKLDHRISLPGYLRKLGVTNIFTDEANLSDLGKSDVHLVVSNMIHQSYVEVSENGTTASSTSSVNFQFLSGDLEFQRNFLFKADEPFLFFICDKEHRIPLFAGKVANPEK